MRNYLLVAKALADESRIRILKLLGEEELCVCQIMTVIGLSQSTISKHLSILKTAGLVDDRKEGIWVFYHLCDEEISEYNQPILELIKGWLNRDRRVVADREKLKEVKQIDIKELCSKRTILKGVDT